MEDVFDTTGRVPEGWMRAVFPGGPYGEDVGRRVLGPPASATPSVPLPEGGVHVYRLWTVGSWSAPDDPTAVYDPGGPPAPPPLLTAQEGRRRQGLGPVGLVALTDDGRTTYDPDAAVVEAMLAGLGERQYGFSKG